MTKDDKKGFDAKAVIDKARYEEQVSGMLAVIYRQSLSIAGNPHM